MIGRSLGGAVAIYSSTIEEYKGKISGFIFENTFTSMPDVISDLAPYLSWLNYFTHNIWPSKDRISGIDEPILFVRDIQDKLIAHTQM